MNSHQSRLLKTGVLALFIAFMSAPAQSKCTSTLPVAPNVQAACKLAANDPGITVTPKGWYCGVNPKDFKRLVDGINAARLKPPKLKSRESLDSGMFDNMNLFMYKNDPEPRNANPAQGRTATLSWKNCVEASVMDKLLAQEKDLFFKKPQSKAPSSGYGKNGGGNGGGKIDLEDLPKDLPHDKLKKSKEKFIEKTL